MTTVFTDAARDLVLGSTCVACEAPGRPLCRGCEAALPRHGRLAWPTPTPPGLAPPFAGGAYDGVLKVMVNEHKEHAVLALATPLGRVLADVVHDLLARLVGGPHGVAALGQVRLVPVPSRAPVVRARGHDPMLRVTRAAARRLRRHGVDAGVCRWLASRSPVADQSTLGADARAANLAGSMSCRRAATGGSSSPGPVVVVDDVLTTGATAREAQRALEQAGLAVLGIATVAATRKQRPVPPSVKFPGVPYRSPDRTSNVSIWSPSGSVVAPEVTGARGGAVARPAPPTALSHIGKPMPVAGEAVHVRHLAGISPVGVDHGAA